MTKGGSRFRTSRPGRTRAVGKSAMATSKSGDKGDISSTSPSVEDNPLENPEGFVAVKLCAKCNEKFIIPLVRFNELDRGHYCGTLNTEERNEYTLCPKCRTN